MTNPFFILFTQKVLSLFEKIPTSLYFIKCIHFSTRNTVWDCNTDQEAPGTTPGSTGVETASWYYPFFCWPRRGKWLYILLVWSTREICSLVSLRLFLIITFQSCNSEIYPLQVDMEYMQSLRAIRDIDQDGVTEDTFHDVRFACQICIPFISISP